MISHIKWSYKNLHFIKGKNTLLACFLFFLIFISCGNDLENVKKDKVTIQQRFLQLYKTPPRDQIKDTLDYNTFLQKCISGDFKQFLNENTVEGKHISDRQREFYLELYQNLSKNLLQENVLEQENKILFDFKGKFDEKYTYIPSEKSHVKDIYQIFLVPGFFLKTIDIYTPMIAQNIVKTILEKKRDKNCAVNTMILPRWASFFNGNKDNIDIRIQYEILEEQINQQIERLTKEYGKNVKIHLIFEGESYGGKVLLFFLNNFMEKLPENVSIDNFITVHSPLYDLSLAKEILKEDHKQILEKINGNLLYSLLSKRVNFLDFLNINAYKTTFELLGSKKIIGVSTDDALKKLLKKNVDIIHFIGTPNELFISDETSISYDTLINLLKITRDFLKNGDIFESLNSICENLGKLEDFVTGIDEIIKDKNSEIEIDILNEITALITLLKGVFEESKSVDMVIENVNTILGGSSEVEINELINEESYKQYKVFDLIKNLYLTLNWLIDFLEKDIQDSDLIVKVEEITKDQTLLTNISNGRGQSHIYSSNGMTYITTPNIFHTGILVNADNFNTELQKSFKTHFEITLN